MLKRSALLAAAMFVSAAPAAAQMREAQLPDIFASYNDCFATTKGGVISAKVLENLGWSRAKTQTSDGEAITDSPIIYGHPDRESLILLSALEGPGACMVTARIASYAVFEEFKGAFGEKLPKADGKGAITFVAEGQAVQIAPTGSREAPALRLAILTSRKSN